MKQPVKLTDFGCAVEMHEHEDIDFRTAGTPQFMAPEVCYISYILLL